jgi:N-acyl-D-amino-acid deacylase
MDFDLLFQNATVYDGTGAPGFVADVAVRGDRIAAVGKLESAAAARTIDARGLALAPGFIDLHGHSDYFLLVLPSAESKIKQGVTTEVGGNCGYSAAPVAGDLFEDRRASHRELYGLDADWHEFGEYLARLAAARPAINFVPLVGFNTVRAAAGWYRSEPPPAETLARMRAMVRASLEAGAAGMSLGLIYAPGCFAGLAELAACAREVHDAGGFVSSHVRSEGEKLIEAIEESLEIARRAEVPFQVSHLKTSGLANWGKLDRVFELIERAREQGLAIRADRYPYIASFTNLSSTLPEWVFDGGKEPFFARLADPAARERMRDELDRADPMRDRFDRIVIAQVFKPELARFENRSVAEAARGEDRDPLDFLCWLTIASHDRAAAIYHTMSLDNLERIYKKEWVAVGSDSAVRAPVGVLAEGYPHPRTFGTFPRVLAFMVREKKWLDLAVAVRKMTLLPAECAGLKQRGKIEPGWYADLCLFDPERVSDTATYERPMSDPVGIELVVVNGKVAVDRGELTGERAGRVLRRGT